MDHDYPDEIHVVLSEDAIIFLMAMLDRDERIHQHAGELEDAKYSHVLRKTLKVAQLEAAAQALREGAR